MASLDRETCSRRKAEKRKTKGRVGDGKKSGWLLCRQNCKEQGNKWNRTEKAKEREENNAFEGELKRFSSDKDGSKATRIMIQKSFCLYKTRSLTNFHWICYIYLLYEKSSERETECLGDDWHENSSVSIRVVSNIWQSVQRIEKNLCEKEANLQESKLKVSLWPKAQHSQEDMPQECYKLKEHRITTK